VSGAGSGIGAAVARRLAAHGCPVAIVDQDEAALRQTSELISDPVLSRAAADIIHQGVSAAVLTLGS
jgi:NAD(P)-dependent dehydrogenase (short-subunit alcohol dehydrogenase family)